MINEQVKEALMQKLSANPNMNFPKAMEYVKDHGGDPKEACFELFKENGIDPNILQDKRVQNSIFSMFGLK